MLPFLSAGVSLELERREALNGRRTNVLILNRLRLLISQEDPKKLWISLRFHLRTNGQQVPSGQGKAAEERKQLVSAYTQQSPCVGFLGLP